MLPVGPDRSGESSAILSTLPVSVGGRTEPPAGTVRLVVTSYPDCVKTTSFMGVTATSGKTCLVVTRPNISPGASGIEISVRRGLALRANLGSNFKRIYLCNGKS